MIAVGDGMNGILFPYQDPEAFNSSWGIEPRHDHGANAVFCDGHVQYDKVENWIEADDIHRRKWNNDNQSHPETWRENRKP